MPWTLNAKAAPPGSYPGRLGKILDAGAHEAARAEIGSWPGYEPTPLRPLPNLAGQLGLEWVGVKDESGRFGLGSFKALGGAYGVRRVMTGGDTGAGAPGFTGQPGSARGFTRQARMAPEAGAARPGDPAPTVTCASDGNHGRAVAWGARTFGLSAVIYLPGHVTEVRAEAIRSFGARVVRVDGEYDDAVARAARDARDNGWTVISDTSYPGYMEIPRVVMVGYTVMVREAVEALQAPPTHVFIQGGVGGLAAAVIGHLWEQLGPDRPVAVIVEPETSDGLYRSGRAGEPRAALGDLHTIMGGLSCREISPLAWEVVGIGAHAFMTVRDGGIAPLMRAAAEGELGEPFEGGESGVAGLLGLVEAAGDPELRQALGLDERSRVLVFNTEGATDPELYERIVGPAANR